MESSIEQYWPKELWFQILLAGSGRVRVGQPLAWPSPLGALVPTAPPTSLGEQCLGATAVAEGQHLRGTLGSAACLVSVTWSRFPCLTLVNQKQVVEYLDSIVIEFCLGPKV